MSSSSQTQSKLPWASEAVPGADETDGVERMSSRVQSAGPETTRPSQLVLVDPKQLRLDAYMHHKRRQPTACNNNNCAPIAEPPSKRTAFASSDSPLVDFRDFNRAEISSSARNQCIINLNSTSLSKYYIKINMYLVHKTAFRFSARSNTVHVLP